MPRTERDSLAVAVASDRDCWPSFRGSISPPRPGALNMALDVELLARAQESGEALLRLYRFEPPCLSLGRHEPTATRYDRAAIDRLGIAVVRRPTGGRAVWHEHELTYAVAAPLGAWGSLRESYRAIHERLARALRALGAPASLAPPAREPSVGAGACFASATGGEVLVRGRKLVGSAQLRDGGAFLQHGSILLAGSQRILAPVSRLPTPPPRETTLAAALGRPVSFDEVARAILGAFGCEPGPPLPIDAARLLSEARHFADPAWTWRC